MFGDCPLFWFGCPLRVEVGVGGVCKVFFQVAVVVCKPGGVVVRLTFLHEEEGGRASEEGCFTL